MKVNSKMEFSEQNFTLLTRQAADKQAIQPLVNLIGSLTNPTNTITQTVEVDEGGTFDTIGIDLPMDVTAFRVSGKIEGGGGGFTYYYKANDDEDTLGIGSDSTPTVQVIRLGTFVLVATGGELPTASVEAGIFGSVTKNHIIIEGGGEPGTVMTFTITY